MLIMFILFVLNLVRTRRLREAYSAFWLIASFGMMILVIRYDWLIAITNFLGIVLPTSTILLLGFLLIFAVEVQVASALTKNHHAIQRITQEIGLINKEIDVLKERLDKSTQSTEKS